MRARTDIETTWTPSFVLMRPVTIKGRVWMIKNTRYNGTIQPIEHRYLADIVLGARADGLVVDTTN